jgi:hypothetical protein
MKYSLKISSLGSVLAVGGALVAGASCAEADPATHDTRADGSTVLEPPPPDAGLSDAGCEAGSDDCAPSGIDCSKADFCPVSTGADSRVAFTAVWGSSKDDVWMVGTQGAIVHWNGASFTTTPSGTKNALFAVTGTGPADVWAVGSRETVLHSTGFANGAATWAAGPSVAPMYAPYGAPSNENLLLALSARAGGEVWTAGEPYPVLPDGSNRPTNMNWWRRGGWSDEPWISDVVASGLVVRGFWAAGASEVWAVGGNASTTTARLGRTFHTSGSTDGKSPVWTEYDSQSFNELNAVWGSSANDVWAVGNAGVVRRWTGASPKRWQVVAAPTDHDLAGVWGSGPNDIWVVGDHGTILHFDGTTWTEPVAAFPAGLSPHLRGVWGSGPNDVWIVGDSMVLHFTGKVGQP